MAVQNRVLHLDIKRCVRFSGVLCALRSDCVAFDEYTCNLRGRCQRKLQHTRRTPVFRPNMKPATSLGVPHRARSRFCHRSRYTLDGLFPKLLSIDWAGRNAPGLADATSPPCRWKVHRPADQSLPEPPLSHCPPLFKPLLLGHECALRTFACAEKPCEKTALPLGKSFLSTTALLSALRAGGRCQQITDE